MRGTGRGEEPALVPVRGYKNDYFDMIALVTGGTGFVGANLVEALGQRGVAVRVLHRESSSLAALEGLSFQSVVGDILDDGDSLTAAMQGCDWVFHVAAVSDYWRNEAEWIYKVNVQGTRNVLAAAKRAGVKRLVFTSSLAAMGLPAPGALLDESSQFNLKPARFPYGHSKHLAEAEVRAAVASGLEAVIVNPAVVLGPRDVNQISGSIIVEAARGLARVRLPGGANYVDVADVAGGHIAAAECGRPGERYILGAHNLSHDEVLQQVCPAVNQPVPSLKVPRWLLPPAAGVVGLARRFLGERIPFDANQVRLAAVNIFASNDKAIRELNLPQTPFAETVQRAVEWYKMNGYI